MRILSVLLFVISVAVYANYNWRQEKTTPSIDDSHIVQLGNIKVTNTITGVFESNSEFDVRSNITAQVLKVLVNEGDFVIKGQPLFEMDCQNVSLKIDDVEISIQRVINSLRHFNKQKTAAISIHHVGGRALKEIGDFDYKITELEFDYKRLKNELKQNNLTKESCLISSQLQGLVTKVKFRTGQLTNKGESIAKIIDIDDKTLTSYVNEFDVQKYRVNQPIEVFMGEYSSRGYKGRVSEIHQVVEKRNGSNLVKVEFTVEKMNNVKIGQQVIINVETLYFENVLIIPRRFLVISENDVFVNSRSNGTLKQLRIRPVGGDYLNIGIREGLAEGTEIVNVNRSARLVEL
ncbi:MAG: efflux RND transporter periplasmic adaptor subunit [Psychrobium sp.]|nr:efflux RND transporter periplasmic adaptor subunit [Psychrobium sp.]